MDRLCVAVCGAMLMALPAVATARPFNDPRSEQTEAIEQAKAIVPRDPACHTLTMAAAGGPLPRDPDTLVVRWIGFSNFELVYKGHIKIGRASCRERV